MSTAIKWITIVVVGGAFGVWFGMSGIEILSLPGILILAGAIFILSFTTAIAHNIYVFRADKNMRAVEAHLNKAKHPYYAFMREMINRRFEEAAAIMPKIKNQEIRANADAYYYIETNRLSEAKEVVPQIKNPDARHLYSSIIALIKSDWDTFEDMKSKIRHTGVKYALDADAAYKKGDYEQAQTFGDLAISNTSGLQRYIFIRGLEHQENNPNRKSYF